MPQDRFSSRGWTSGPPPFWNDASPARSRAFRAEKPGRAWKAVDQARDARNASVGHHHQERRDGFSHGSDGDEGFSRGQRARESRGAHLDDSRGQTNHRAVSRGDPLRGASGVRIVYNSDMKKLIGIVREDFKAILLPLALEGTPNQILVSRPLRLRSITIEVDDPGNEPVSICLLVANTSSPSGIVQKFALPLVPSDVNG